MDSMKPHHPMKANSTISQLHQKTIPKRFKRHLNKNAFIRSDYSLQTVSRINLPIGIPKYPSLTVRWIGYGAPIIDDNHYSQSYLVEIINPDAKGSLCLVDLFQIGLQHIATRKEIRNCEQSCEKACKKEVCVENLSEKANVQIGQGRDPNALKPFAGKVPICGTSIDTKKPFSKKNPTNPYTLTFTGSSCFLKVSVPGNIIGPFPSGDLGSPPPPFTGGRPLVPR